MSSVRLSARITSAVNIGSAILYEHSLHFHKKGKTDSTAKCDAFHTANPNDYIAGVLYKIDPDHREILDDIEGLGKGYEIKTVEVETVNDEKFDAFTYYATHIDRSLKPLHWYKHHVLHGARENNLPPEYIEKILSVESTIDTDIVRAQKELSIYDNFPVNYQI